MNTQQTDESTASIDPVPEIMVTGGDRSKRLLRVGAFSFLGLVILIIGVFVIGDKQSLFSKTFTVIADFKSVAGLKSGALVMINGIKIGSVSRVDLMLDTSSFVRVTMMIDEEEHKFIRTSTIASVAQQGLIGDKQVELVVGDASAPTVRDGAHIQAELPTNYTAILDDAHTAVKNTEAITASLDTLFLRFRRGEGTIGKFLTDDAAYLSLTRVTNATERLLNTTNTQIASITSTLTRAAGSVDGLTSETAKLVSDIGNGKGTLGALLYDRSLYDTIAALSSTLNEAASSVSFGAREFGIDMRGLRSSWLGGLFRGNEPEENRATMMMKELEIRLEEVRRQKELLDRREREMMQKTSQK